MTDFKWSRDGETERQESHCGQITARLSTAATTIRSFDVLKGYLMITFCGDTMKRGTEAT